MFTLLIMACAGQMCFSMMQADGDPPAPTVEACLLPLDDLLELAEARLMQEAATENHTFAWDCIDADIVAKAKEHKLPLPLRYHRVIYHDAHGTDI